MVRLAAILTAASGCLLGTALAGCNGGMSADKDYYRLFESENPGERIAAIRAAADAGDRRAMPQLVNCLSDPEADVRLFAITGLRKLTGGEDFGYRHFDAEPSRREAIGRWREWLRSRATTGPATAGNK